MRHLSTGTSLAFCSVDIFKLKLKVSGEPTLIKRNENCCFAAFKSNYLLLITLFIINYYKLLLLINIILLSSFSRIKEIFGEKKNFLFGNKKVNFGPL